MKKIITAFLFTFGTIGVQAQIFQSKNATIDFFSSTPMEDIKALNKNVQSIFNSATGDIVFKVPNSGFKFDKALMEEHFHENYMETAKYPNSEFKGKIQEKIDFTKDGVYDATVVGKLNIHGVEKERTIKGKITVKGAEISVDSKFEVALKDHKIEVPKLVAQNIAENMAVTVNANYAPYQKKQ